jgi:hemerythrin-like domain-containing protein
MSATEHLLQDHVFIRRLQTVIEKCYAYLNESRDVPVGDIIKIADIIEQFVDQCHHNKEESGDFPEAENREVDRFSEEIRKFVIEHTNLAGGSQKGSGSTLKSTCRAKMEKSRLPAT